jgi:hypothetical protein
MGGGLDEAGRDFHGGLLVRAWSGKISVAMELYESASIDHALAGLLRGRDILLHGIGRCFAYPAIVRLERRKVVLAARNDGTPAAFATPNPFRFPRLRQPALIPKNQ